MSDLEELRYVDRADVYKKEHLAATLSREAEGVVFAYAPAYIESVGRPIASGLPLSLQPLVTRAGALPPYFSNLLPEGRRLAALRNSVKTSLDDELSLLLAVGADAVGDVRIVAAGVVPGEVEPRVRVHRWSDVSFAEVFALETGADPDRVALAGAQPKASARIISFPVRRGTERFILKLDPPEFKHLCRNEWLMLEAARRSGLTTVSADLVTDNDGREALAVQRFDRQVGGGLLGVEDGCQVLGRYPADKYLVTTEETCAGLAAVSDAPIVAARTLLRWVTFAYVSGNGDLHAKNLALAERPDGTWLASPAYDLPASYPYGDTTMALTLRGRSDDSLGRADFLELATLLGVSSRAASRVLDEVVGAVDLWLPLLDDSGFGQRTVHKWRRLVLHRRDRLRASRLTEK
jgi:serine/threonine-protein kinase HipA